MVAVLEYSVRIFQQLPTGTSRGIAALSAPWAAGPGAAVVVTIAALPCSEPTLEARISWEARGVGIVLRNFMKTCFTLTRGVELMSANAKSNN